MCSSWYKTQVLVLLSLHILGFRADTSNIKNVNYCIMFYCVHLNIKGSCRWSLKSLIWPWKNWKNGLMSICWWWFLLWVPAQVQSLDRCDWLFVYCFIVGNNRHTRMTDVRMWRSTIRTCCVNSDIQENHKRRLFRQIKARSKDHLVLNNQR